MSLMILQSQMSWKVSVNQAKNSTHPFLVDPRRDEAVCRWQIVWSFSVDIEFLCSKFSGDKSVDAMSMLFDEGLPIVKLHSNDSSSHATFLKMFRRNKSVRVSTIILLRLGKY